MIDHLPVLGFAELVQMLGLSRTRVVQLVARDEFPDPIARLRMGPVWSFDEVDAYCRRTGRAVHSERAEDDSA